MMHGVADARALMLRDITSLGDEDVALHGAYMRILAAPLRAARDQPPCDVAAMDGYAFRGADIPAKLRIIGESAAGRPFESALPPATCVRISTGAHLPAGADTVLMQEDSIIENACLIVSKAPRQAHMRARAADFAERQTLLSSGRRLGIGDLALAAAAGAATLRVARAPRIAILCSGDELASPGAPVLAHQIYESASFALAALIRSWGGEPRLAQPLPDDPERIAQAAADALADSDLLVLVGGASVGPHDYGRAALRALGFDCLVEKIAIKPGKPTWFARGPRGAVLGLPGNPASALVCARLFLVPIIEAMLGASGSGALEPNLARLAAPLTANGPRETYLRARLASDESGYVLMPAKDQDSSFVSVLSQTNALIMRAPNASPVAAQDSVPFLNWTPSAST